MTDYKKHLKLALITDEKIITYRQLSRELKVHVNVAKEMLYGFHHELNLRTPGSCHATYILSGIQRLPKGTSPSRLTSSPTSTPSHAPSLTPKPSQDEDEVMQSSPFELSQAISEPDGGKQDTQEDGGDGMSGETGTVRSIVLVPEEKLEEVKKSFVVLSSIHVYSLSPARVKDLMLLADNSVEVQMADAKVETPQEIGRTFGGIVNPLAKRRIGPRGVPYPTAPAPTSAAAAAAGGKTKMEPSGAAGIASKTAAIKLEDGGKKGSILGKPSETHHPSAAAKKAQADFFKAFGGGKKKEPTTQTPPAKKPKKEEPEPEPESEPEKMDLDEPADDDPDVDTSSAPPDTGAQPKLKQKPTSKPARSKKHPSSPSSSIASMFKNQRPKPSQFGDDDEAGEDDDEEDALPPSKRAASNAAALQKRKERDEKLRKMMEDSDDEEKAEQEKAEQKEEEPSPPSPPPPPSHQPESPHSQDSLPAPTPSTTITPNPRKRCRRKVSKKVTTRDDEGYLVTKWETAWESFSEDDDAPSHPPPTSSGFGSQPGKGSGKAGRKEEDSGGSGKKTGSGKKAGAGQQGNIMSFFAKK